MVKFGIGLVTEEGCDTFVRHSVRAEKAGIDYVFVSDHLKSRNVHVCLTAIAYNTHKILIGPGITNPYLIHPVATAQILSSINEVAPNRVVCGIGAGDKGNLKRVGINPVKPLAAVREATQIIRTILTDGVVDVDGEVFKISNERFGFPPADHLPILIGAQGDQMLRLAGKVGDGVIINAADPDECERAIRIVRKSGKEMGRSLERFVWAAAMPFSVSRIADDALKPLLPSVAVVAAGGAASILERHGISLEDRDRVREALRRNDYEGIARSVTPEMIESLSIAGTPETCVQKISRLIKSGVDLVILASPLGPVIDDSIDMVARDITPEFG